MTTNNEFMDVLKQNAKFMERISIGITAINHSNQLHKEAIESNTNATKELAVEMRSIMSMFRWVMIALILAIIALAGAEKIFKFLPPL